MVQSEEEYLLKKYGEEYKKYCFKVPRYIGLINKDTI
jgi:protein-S-isoprenylcysteine O-methyltransferase Ste14